MAKNPTSFRLSPEALHLIERMAAHLGVSQAAVVEQAVRALARREKLPEEPESKDRGKK